MNPLSTRSKRRHPRGGAAVETAALMIVLVPLIMYALFLEDLLFYHFDQQEAVTSSPWDMMAFDYRHQSAETSSMGTAQHFNRLTYADHSSASNSYDNPTIDTNDEGHHQALAAHQCWLAKGGQQVTFGQDSSVGDVLPAGFKVRILSGGPSGGLYSVSAILGVQNYFLPQKFMQDYWGTKNNMTDQARWTDGSIHGNAKEDGYAFPKDSLAVVHDSWALNFVRGIGSKDMSSKHDDMDAKLHPLNLANEWTQWVQAPYDMESKVDTAEKFADEATNKKLLTKTVKLDGPMGDDLGTVPITWSKEYDKKFSDDTAPSGMKDSRVSDTAGQLQDSYMGQDPSKW